MFTRGDDGVYRSPLLSSSPWLVHGFGSLHSPDWPGRYTQVKQVHSATVVRAEGHQGSIGSGDALVTSEGGQLIGIRTADCVPVLLADPRLRVVAAVHAGWRGSSANIAAEAVGIMQAEYGSNPADLLAAIGPSIAECCFAVGPEVAAQFVRWIPDAEALPRIDLVEVNRKQLEDAGVPASQVDIAALCTMCSPAGFHSWRRDREVSGRMVAAIGLAS